MRWFALEGNIPSGFHRPNRGPQPQVQAGRVPSLSKEASEDADNPLDAAQKGVRRVLVGSMIGVKALRHFEPWQQQIVLVV